MTDSPSPGHLARQLLTLKRIDQVTNVRDLETRYHAILALDHRLGCNVGGVLVMLRPSEVGQSHRPPATPGAACEAIRLAMAQPITSSKTACVLNSHLPGAASLSPVGGP